MHHLLKDHHPRNHAKSFQYAFNGLFHALLNERNFRIQILISLIVLILGYIYQLTKIEWALLFLALGFLLSAEMINTVVEHFIDELIKEYNDVARIIKDVSAGFVLISALTALGVFLILFL